MEKSYYIIVTSFPFKQEMENGNGKPDLKCPFS